jgi:hypothetical protein
MKRELIVTRRQGAAGACDQSRGGAALCGGVGATAPQEDGFFQESQGQDHVDFGQAGPSGGEHQKNDHHQEHIDEGNQVDIRFRSGRAAKAHAHFYLTPG